MIKLSENVQVKLTKEEKRYLDIISEKYKYKRSVFIRDSIREKMIRDVPKLRQKLKNKIEECPF